jgi:hypothetical protein
MKNVLCFFVTKHPAKPYLKWHGYFINYDFTNIQIFNYDNKINNY